MSQYAPERRDDRQSRRTTAIVLIGIGVILLIGQLTEAWEWMMPLLGLGFLAAYFWTRNYGFLVPGGVLTGIGVGILLTTIMSTAADETEGALFLVSLGFGFALIWILDIIYTRASNWWPLIPGGILVLVGLALGIGGAALDLLEVLGRWWPVILIAIGAWILFTLWRQPEEG
jgi:hypothetical protein